MVLNILIVDDERLIADTLAIIFRRAGFKAYTAYSGLDGLEAARRFRPSLVLSDVNMPGLDGISMAMAIQQEIPSTAIMLFSGQASTTELLSKAEILGFHYEILQKPVPAPELLRRAWLALGGKAAIISNKSKPAAAAASCTPIRL